MLTSEKLKEKAEEMQLFLEQRVGPEPVLIIDRLESLSVMLAQSGSFLAQARFMQDTVISGTIEKFTLDPKFENISASTLNKFVNAAARESNYLVNTFDRINSAIVHQIDSLRSILSYKKSEMLIL